MTTINYKEKYEEYHSKFWAGYHTNNVKLIKQESVEAL